MKQETQQWRAYRHSQLLNGYGHAPHLSCATETSRYGVTNLTSLVERRSKRLSRIMRDTILRDRDGAFRVHNRIDGKYVNANGKLVQG